MSTSARYWADLGERAGRSFLQGFLALWIANPSAPVEFDTLFTVENLKAGLAVAFLSVAMSILGKNFGNPGTASFVLPEAEPAPRPVDVKVDMQAPLPVVPLIEPEPPAYLVAAVFSHRLGTWSTVYLHPEINPDEGTFVLTGETHEGLPVAVYQPGEPATHTPVGPTEMSALGLRPKLPEPF